MAAPHAGSGDVQSMTMDLAAARGLAADVGHLLQGVREVDEVLGLTAGQPEPTETPTPD